MDRALCLSVNLQTDRFLIMHNILFGDGKVHNFS